MKRKKDSFENVKPNENWHMDGHEAIERTKGNEKAEIKKIESNIPIKYKLKSERHKTLEHFNDDGVIVSDKEECAICSCKNEQKIKKRKIRAHKCSSSSSFSSYSSPIQTILFRFSFHFTPCRTHICK